MSKKSIKRRDFLKKSTKLAVAAAATSVSPTFQAFAQTSKEYEFIIVGSGAGGGPLAANLANAGFSVLLIEAGANELPLTAQIPAYHALSSEDPEISWDFFVRHHDQPHEHAKWAKSTFNEKEGVLYPRASVVGGCTAHNAMVCLYPDHDDWNRIYQMSGRRDATWTAGYMRKLFNKKIENGHYFTDGIPFTSHNKGWHHLEMSPLSLLKKDSLLQKIVFGAAKEKFGYWDEAWNGADQELKNLPRINSYLDANNLNHVDHTGFLRIPKSTYIGKRWGVHEYINNVAKERSNLTILPHTLVKKVHFEKTPEGLKATGVEVLEGRNLYRAHKKSDSAQVRKQYFIKASNEVILAGGAFNSPQLLMLSGIGPADQYDSHTPGAPIKGAPLKVLEGVGRNLQDRYEVTVVTNLDDEFELLKNCQFDHDFNGTVATQDQCLTEWLDLKTRNKSVYSTNGIVVAIKMRSSVCQEGKTDLVLFGAPGEFRGYYPGYSRTVTKDKNKFSWAILKGHSRNRKGRVKLLDDDCRNTPDIHFHYFEGPGAKEDMQAVYEGLQRVRSINFETFGSDENATDHAENKVGKGEIFPGTDFQNEAGLKSWINREAWGHHASCSNKMGLDESDGAVVDFDFKVHGTTNLRVVDASVFPEIPGLFIVTPIYMISEKASEVIIKKYKRKSWWNF